MYDGQVKCCGSTIFLKKLYHVGYLLRVQTTKEPNDPKSDALLSMIKQYIPNACLENHRTNERFYRLTTSNETGESLNLMIARLLDAFESSEIQNQYAIEGYGLTNTTLEDVFIKIGTLDAPQNAIAMETNVADHPLYNLQRLAGPALWLQQFWAILAKKFKMSYKSLALIWQSSYLVVPFVTLSFVLAAGLKNIVQSKDVSFDSFNLRELKGNKDFLVMHNATAGSAESDLFRRTNLDWMSEEYGLNIVESKRKTLKEALEDEMLKWSRTGLMNRLVLVPQRFDKFAYRTLANPTKMPYALVGSIELFYRLVAREVGKDINVNLKFSYFQPSGLAGKTEDDQRMVAAKSLNDIYVVLIFRLMLDIAISFCIALMFSFPFIAFVELPHEEMNSGVSLINILNY